MLWPVFPEWAEPYPNVAEIGRVDEQICFGFKFFEPNTDVAFVGTDVLRRRRNHQQHRHQAENHSFHRVEF